MQEEFIRHKDLIYPFEDVSFNNEQVAALNYFLNLQKEKKSINDVLKIVEDNFHYYKSHNSKLVACKLLLNGAIEINDFSKIFKFSNQLDYSENSFFKRSTIYNKACHVQVVVIFCPAASPVS